MSDDHIQGQLASGEVLLIDTRQHWVAAVRYAIRPILIAGAGVLLSLLNQWLRFERLGFINDILHWIVLILFIVAIVWLPIDLVRWWSRRYVLTNRRAMRMEGVLRKSSMDSSLEQINDIMLSQSFLGRQLGYADLTLLTANAANDAYEQLLDGAQFKKAVLDAKEAIRSGSPLAALPDGFVVKGGTNEASRGATTRSADDAAAAGSAAAATVMTTAAATMGIHADPDEPETQAGSGATAGVAPGSSAGTSAEADGDTDPRNPSEGGPASVTVADRAIGLDATAAGDPGAAPASGDVGAGTTTGGSATDGGASQS